MARLARASVLAALFLVACGETLLRSDDPVPDAGDDGGVDGRASDARDDAFDDGGGDATSDDADAGATVPCAADLPFGTAQLLTEVAPLGDVTSVRLERDGGALAFVTADSGPPYYFDIFEVNFPMGASDVPTKLVATSDDEGSPAPLTGGMKIYFEQSGADAGTRRIASASRTQAGQNLSGVTPEALPSSPLGGSAMQPWSVAGTDVLYYVVRPGTANSSDIYRAEKNGAMWEASVQIMGATDETHPVVTDDELVMYFARNDSGKRRVHVATRVPGSQWGTALPVDAANDSLSNSEPTWISPDQCTLFFTSDRSGAPRAYKVVRQR